MKFKKFVEEIMEYESDTFSASGFELTESEAKQIAEKLLDYFSNNYLDGVILDGTLAEMRDL